MSTCMECSQLLARPAGPQIILNAVAIAIEASRADIETECVQIIERDHTWWDTASGLFDGNCENDIEFRAMRDRAVKFLDDMGQIEHHPDHPAWIRFTQAPA